MLYAYSEFWPGGLECIAVARKWRTTWREAIQVMNFLKDCWIADKAQKWRAIGSN